MAVLVAIISQFLVGYNTAVMNAPSAVVFPDHTTTQWSVAVAAFAVGGPAGALVGGLLANQRGRRYVACVLLGAYHHIMASHHMTSFARDGNEI